MEKKKRFGVLLCAEDSDYVKRKYGGYFGVYVSMLGEEGEAWDVYRVSVGEFPEDGAINGYDGFVVTGSRHDAHSNNSWVCKLVSLLQRLDSMKKKVLGICFGHQILSRVLGGKTGRATTGWDIGVRTVNLKPSKSLSAFQIPSLMTIIECHRDEVLELPPFAEVIAWSEKTGIEMFRYGEHIMGIQGHPEYTKDILTHLIDRLLQHNLIQDSDAVAANASLEAYEPDYDTWQQLCRGFLKGRL